METWWRAYKWRSSPEAVEVIRHTAKFIVVPWYGGKERRESKVGVFPTKEEAWEHLEISARASLASDQRSLDTARSRLAATVSARAKDKL